MKSFPLLLLLPSLSKLIEIVLKPSMSSLGAAMLHAGADRGLAQAEEGGGGAGPPLLC